MRADRFIELGKLLGRRQLAVEQQVGNLDEARPLGQLLDRIAAVLKNALFAVYISDRALAARGGGESGVVVKAPVCA
jgi:hypothetical protein